MSPHRTARGAQSAQEVLTAYHEANAAWMLAIDVADNAKGARKARAAAAAYKKADRAYDECRDALINYVPKSLSEVALLAAYFGPNADIFEFHIDEIFAAFARASRNEIPTAPMTLIAAAE